MSLKQCLKGVEIRFCCDFNDCGRLFQILADALGKALSPSVFFDRREWSSNLILDTMLVKLTRVVAVQTMLDSLTGYLVVLTRKAIRSVNIA